MFRNLRPHKRVGSTPSSPAEQSHTFEPYFHSNSHDHGHPPRWQDTGSAESITTTSPPFLPPIQRVTSAGSETDTARSQEREPRTQVWETSSRGNTRHRDNFAYSNHHRIPLRPESAGNVAPSTQSQPARVPAKTFDSILSQTPFEGPQRLASFAEIQDRGRETGRRPTGTRLPTPPPADRNTFEPVHQKSGKTRKLLNPMSLLARRRTSTAVSQISLDSAATRTSQNATFDPNLTIQGKFHDFDKPTRPKRNVSYNDVRAAEEASSNVNKLRSPNAQYESDHDATSPWSGGNHTPVFTENFEEEQYPAAGPHVRKASDLTDLPLPAPPYAHGASRSIEPKNIEPPQREAQPPPRKISARKPVPSAPDRAPPPVPPKADEPALQKRISIDPAATPPKSNSLKTGRPRNVSDVSIKDGSAIPKHMKSTSSRFSFDMIGAAEQERLLEDRHRQRALEKKAGDPAGDEGDDFDDDFDYDAMMDDDGLEERIPGVNADLEDDLEIYKEPIPGINADTEEDLEEEEVPQSHDHLGGFMFNETLLTPLSPQSPGMAVTPRDADGNVIGFAITKNSPQLSGDLHQASTVLPASPDSDDMQTSGADTIPKGLGLQGLAIQDEEPSPETEHPSEFPQAPGIDEDDLYFDDGIITGPVDKNDAAEFDESVFDNIDTDQYGRPLNQLSTLPTLYPPPVIAPDPSPSLQKIDENAESKTTTSVISPTFPPTGSLAPKPSISDRQTSVPTHGLTENSLAAYQSALAAAAFTAAAAGKFRRDSTTTISEPEGPGLIPDSGHNSQYEPFSPANDFDFDDSLEDDAIIAAANAEALAHDDDGFYGQEFGFYSAPASSTQEVEYVNGGYFGPRGVEGVNRSTSGRNREPNLTPITERSEYSNRNSFMSLNMHGPGSASVTSPGLAQLAGMMSSPDFDPTGDMSLGSLMKLRRGAWGGSQASLHSSNGSRNGEELSPVTQTQTQNQTQTRGNHRRKNSAFSIEESEADSPPGSPTLTMSVPALEPQAIGTVALKDGAGVLVQAQGQAHGHAKDGYRKHKKTGSTESVSYVKEDGERWILERRRTAEDGGIEVLGREVVMGGRI